MYGNQIALFRIYCRYCDLTRPYCLQAAKNKKKRKGVTLQVSRGDGLDDYEAAAYDGFDDFI